MARVVGDIAVEVSADIGPLQREMQKGTRSTQQFGKDFETTAQRMAKMAGKVTLAIGAISVAAGALGSVAQMVTQQAREIETLSQTAGVGVERFQSLSFAVREYGIESEKLSDILKDVNDKFGDFFANGGGPLKDFFDNIAPKVGVTADQFKRLSSADALGLYVQTLEAANVSQSEMTFYMEALANDATRLVPLLSNNADEMKRLEQNARDLGIVLSEDLVERTSRMATIWNKLVDSMRAKFVSFASTVLVGLDNIFGLTDAGQLANMRDEMFDLADQRMKLLRQIEDEESRAGRSSFGTSDNTEIQRLRMSVEATEEEMNLINDGMRSIQEAAEERERAKADLEEALSGGGAGGGEESGGGKGSKDRFSETDLERLKDQFASERELLQEDYSEKLTMLNEFLEAKKISQEEYNEYVEKLQRDHNNRMTQLEMARQAATLNEVLSGGQMILQGIGAFNKKALKLAQATAAAQALVSTYQGAAKELEKGTLGFATAAAVFAKGLSFVAAINNISASSYGGVAAGGGGGAAGAGTTAPTAPAEPAISQQVAISVTGEIFSQNQVLALIEQINEAVGDGATVRLA
ncbi:hypothetical protein [Roseovarius amoyensis]|uniref:hypothetical protein n=1 Tax=Roseovarius amoyensis TaxID=2211448 RepID=UPI000DBE76E8|nr:hypothetical protein [Roseovarius amoyensis]